MAVLQRSLVVLVLAAAACRFEAGDLDDLVLKCEPPDGRCPSGQSCIGGVCQAPDAPDASADAPPGAADAGADAALGVCELAAQAPDNDRCDQAIALGAAISAGGVTVYGDTRGYADDLHPAVIATCSGALEQGPDAVYEFTGVVGQHIIATLAPAGWDGALYLLDDCSGAATCLGGKNVVGNGLESIDIALPASGTYFLVVDATAAASAGCFTLTAELGDGS